MVNEEEGGAAALSIPTSHCSNDGDGQGNTGSEGGGSNFISPSTLPRPHLSTCSSTVAPSTKSSLGSCLCAFPEPSAPSVSPTPVAPAVEEPMTMPDSQLPSFPEQETKMPNEPHTVSPLFSALELAEEERSLHRQPTPTHRSPLLASVKDLPFERRGTARDSEACRASPQLRTATQWQEENAPPPVPTIPSHFEAQTIQTGGWTKYEDPEADGQEGKGAGAKSDIIKVDPREPSSECHRESLTCSSSARTVGNMASDQSMDTSSTSTAGFQRRESLGSSVKSPTISAFALAEKRWHGAKTAENKSPFAFTLESNHSCHSITSSRTPSRPDSASRRIAFAPSVRIASSNPPKRETSVNREAKAADGISEEPGSAGQVASVAQSPPRPPSTPKGRKPPAEKSSTWRPSTAPSLPRRTMSGGSSLRTLLRPLSRGRREAEERQETGASAESGVEGEGSKSRESIHSVHAPLHPDGPFGPLQPEGHDPLQATRVEELPSPPRAFYPGTLILIKQGQEGAKSQQILDALRSTEPRPEELEQEREVLGSEYPEGENAQREEQNVLWRGAPMHVNRDERRGIQWQTRRKLKRAVTRLSAVFSFRPALSEKVLDEVQFDFPPRHRQGESRSETDSLRSPLPPPWLSASETPLTKRSSQGWAKSRTGSSRPSTAPSAVSAPRWGSAGLNKMAKIVSRQDRPAQTSILVGTKGPNDRLEALRDNEELRKRTTIWDQEGDHSGSPSYPPSSVLSHPGWQRRSSEQGWQASRTSEQSSSSHFTTPSSHSPVSRVSVDQLKQMQPIKIVKQPLVY